MGSRKWVGGLRLFLGFLLAPAVAPLFVAVCLNYVLTWFRPEASNMAIGMFAFLIVSVTAVVTYPLGITLGALYVCGRDPKDRTDARTARKSALVSMLSCSVGAAAIPLLAREYALAAAMAVVAALAFLLSGMCFYVICCAGRTPTMVDLTD